MKIGEFRSVFKPQYFMRYFYFMKTQKSVDWVCCPDCIAFNTEAQKVIFPRVVYITFIYVLKKNTTIVIHDQMKLFLLPLHDEWHIYCNKDYSFIMPLTLG